VAFIGRMVRIPPLKRIVPMHLLFRKRKQKCNNSNSNNGKGTQCKQYLFGFILRGKKYCQPRQHYKNNIKNKVLCPTQFFQDPATGARDKIGEIEDDKDIRREHYHKCEEGIEGYGSETFCDKQEYNSYFHTGNQPCDHFGISTEKGRLCQLDSKGFKVEELTGGGISE